MHGQMITQNAAKLNQRNTGIVMHYVFMDIQEIIALIGSKKKNHPTILEQDH